MEWLRKDVKLMGNSVEYYLAKGLDIKESIKRGKEYISGALNAQLDLGKGSGPMMHNFILYDNLK